jgi:Arc/MetJ-type ribon-helix-helix transcriptional regulator
MEKEPTVNVTLTLPQSQVDYLDGKAAEGTAASRSHACRLALAKVIAADTEK